MVHDSIQYTKSIENMVIDYEDDKNSMIALAEQGTEDLTLL